MLRDSKRLDSGYECLCCRFEMNVDELLMRPATKRIFLMPDNGGFLCPALSLISCPPCSDALMVKKESRSVPKWPNPGS